MKRNGVLALPKKYIPMTNSCMYDDRFSVRVDGKLSKYFGTDNGLKHGNALSPLIVTSAIKLPIKSDNLS